MFLGPITDKTTRDEIVDLLGNHEVDVDDHATLAPKATAQDRQQLTWGRALVVSGSLPPAVVRFAPYWRTGGLAHLLTFGPDGYRSRGRRFAIRDDHTKRLAVFGASGGVGRHVITDALADGYEVRAFVRDASKLTLSDPHLTVVVDQLDDAERVGEAVAGADAVVSALGPDLSRGMTGMALVDGTRAIVTAMQNAGVDRYIGMATPSLCDERDTPASSEPSSRSWAG
jgi:NAD(P)H-binding